MGVTRRDGEGASSAKSTVLNLEESCKQVLAQSEATCGRCGWVGVTLSSLNRQTATQLLRPCPFICSFILSLVHSAGECRYVLGTAAGNKGRPCAPEAHSPA